MLQIMFIFLLVVNQINNRNYMYQQLKTDTSWYIYTIYTVETV